MSFFSNPLAEEDEVVPPDYPLGQYDERKREDDFNELLVRSTKLEAQYRASGGGTTTEQPDLVVCFRENQQLRSTLEELWGEMRDDVDARQASLKEALLSSVENLPSLPAPSPPSSTVNVVIDAVSAQMEGQALQREAAASQLMDSVSGLAAPLVEGKHAASVLPTASAFTALQTTAMSHSPHEALPTSRTAGELSAAVDMREVGDAVRALEAQLPCMSAEEAALASAAVRHLLFGMQSWTSLVERRAGLRRSVLAKAQEQKEAHLAARTVAVWTASKQMASESAVAHGAAPASLAVGAAAPLSFDLAVAEAFNKELNEGNLRLEAVLARLLAGQEGPRQTSLAGSALVQYVGLLDHARELEEEVHRLGSAVLYLRAALTDPASVDAQELVSAASTSLTSAMHAPLSPAPCESVWAARQQQINHVEKSLREPATRAEEAAALTTDVVADEILLHGLTKLLELYDACLNGVALLSAHFEKQSANATFLVHAMRGGGPLDDATVERVLDVPVPDVAAVRESFADCAASCARVAADLHTHVQKAAKAAATALARWDSVRTLLVDLLRQTLSLLPPDSGDGTEMNALLAAYADCERPSSLTTDMPLRECVQVAPRWAEVLQEEVAVFQQEKAAQRTRVKELWLTQQAEANKKMTWLMKQPNAPLLQQLCAAEKEKGELQQQIQLHSSATTDTAELQHTLAEVQRQVEAETLYNTRLQNEVDEVRANKLQLEEERASLSALLSQA